MVESAGVEQRSDVSGSLLPTRHSGWRSAGRRCWCTAKRRCRPEAPRASARRARPGRRRRAAGARAVLGDCRERRRRGARRRHRRATRCESCARGRPTCCCRTSRCRTRTAIVLMEQVRRDGRREAPADGGDRGHRALAPRGSSARARSPASVAPAEAGGTRRARRGRRSPRYARHSAIARTPLPNNARAASAPLVGRCPSPALASEGHTR